MIYIIIYVQYSQWAQCVLFSRVYYKYETNKKNIIYFFCLFFFNNLSKDAFHDPSRKDCKQSNSLQTHALLNLAKQLPVKGLIDNRCHALEAVPERRAIHKLNANFFLQKIKSECKYIWMRANNHMTILLTERLCASKETAFLLSYQILILTLEKKN